MKKIAITGGSGFIGSHLVDILIEKGHAVTIFDRHYNSSIVKEYNWKDKKIDFRIGDLKDKDSVFELVRNCDIIVNLGGLLGTAEMLENFVEAVEVNILGALNVFNAARLHKKRVFQIFMIFCL